jgi:hypothetical protein
VGGEDSKPKFLAKDKREDDMPKAKVTNKGKAPVKGPVKGAKAPVAESVAARKARLMAEEKAKARMRK